MKILKKNFIKDLVMILAIVFGGFYMSSPVFAGCTGSKDPNCNKVCSDSNIDDAQKAAAGCDMSTAKEDQLPSRINNIITIVATSVGILAVLVIVIGGQRYLVSGGDPGKIKQAKDMILYAVIALIVAGLAYAIVTFISSNLTSNANMNTH